MPYKFETDKLQVPRSKRRNVKLTFAQHDEIRELHVQGISIHELARRYSVNKRLIQFILFPERQLKNKLDREKRGGWKIYYDKQKNTEHIRDTRRYKQSIINELVPFNGTKGE